MHAEILAIIMIFVLMEILTTFFILRHVKMYLKSVSQINSDKIEGLRKELSDDSGKLDNITKASIELKEALKELNPKVDERSAELIKLLQVFLDDINSDKLTEEEVNNLKKDLYAWIDKVRATPSEVLKKKQAEVKKGYDEVNSRIVEKSSYRDMYIFRKLLDKVKEFIETADLKAFEDERMNAYQSAMVVLQILQYLDDDYDTAIRVKKLKDLGYH